MKITWRVLAVLTLLPTAVAGAAPGADEEAYNQRAAARDVGLFEALDRDRNGAVTRDEARGDLNFSPRFDDMDIDRDGIVTRAELERYIALRYQVKLSPPN